MIHNKKRRKLVEVKSALVSRISRTLYSRKRCPVGTRKNKMVSQIVPGQAVQPWGGRDGATAQGPLPEKAPFVIIIILILIKII